MMSMGSLGHYMHDLSAHGFGIHDFLHEGNGDIWNFAITDPRAVVGWIAIEEKAEGGDALYLEAQAPSGISRWIHARRRKGAAWRSIGSRSAPLQRAPEPGQTRC